VISDTDGKNKKTDWKETRKISLYEVDFFNKLRIDSTFNYLQEAASNHAIHLGWGYIDLIKNELTWILSRIKLVVYEYKNLGDMIEIETFPKGIDNLFALRDFRLRDRNQKIFALATSAWLLINVNTLRPVKSEEFYNFINYISRDSESAINGTPGKINFPGKIETIYEHRIRYTDLDLNYHVNNAKYIEFILDCFDIQNFHDREISSIQVNFLGELKYGDKVKISKGIIKEKTGDIYIEGMKNNKTKVFQSIINWK